MLRKENSLKSSGAVVNENHIDLFGTTVSVWEEHVRDDLKGRVLDPLIRFLRARGWRVKMDPQVTHLLSLRDTHKIANKGELWASLQLTGRHLKLEIWQDAHNITHPNGGRYEFDKRARMPFLLGLRCDLELNRVREFLVAMLEYPVTDRRYLKETADERIARNYRESWHTDATLGHPRYTNGDRDRTSADGVLLEQGQTVWYYDSTGRLLRGAAFYSLNNMQLVKFGRMDLRQIWCGDLYAHRGSVGDVRSKMNAKRRDARLRGLMKSSADRLDFLAADKFRRLLGLEVSA